MYRAKLPDMICIANLGVLKSGGQANRERLFKMQTYRPDSFSPEYGNPVGAELWEFLLYPQITAKLISATELGHPAAEGIEEDLLARFEKDADFLLSDRVKMMIGHMIRQIMEAHGYVIDMQNVRITNGGPFTKATRYKLPDQMTFHVFKGAGRQMALTADKAGVHLPEDFKGSYWKSFKGSLRGRIAFGVEDEKQARTDIQKQGYHVYEMKRALRVPD